ESEVAGDAYFRKITEEDRAGLRSPELIGPLVGYLLSPGSWNVNGRVFVAEGRAIAVCPDDLPVRTVYTQDGPWSVDGLTTIVPDVLLAGMPNPAPPNPDARPDGRVAAGEPRVD
ncbi:MAG TPA: hypothetical protein VHW47_04835, partial [Acidimicrobiales bacterium]|nr:hypothetical protein [Acidimicrobiales bacterium]